MKVKVDIRGLSKLNKFSTEIPFKIDKELALCNERFIMDVRDDAILYAPEDTGSMKKTIVLEPVKQSKNTKMWKLLVDAPYAVFQEIGFTPHRVYPQQRISAKYPDDNSVWMVKKYTPFVQPSINQNIGTLYSQLDLRLNKALRS